MATNVTFSEAGTLSLPVPSNTKSGELVIVGGIPGVALTDEGDGGNADDWATVLVTPAPVVELAVKGEKAAAAALAIGDPIALDVGVINGDDTNGTVIGHALGAVESGATTTIRVRLAAVATS